MKYVTPSGCCPHPPILIYAISWQLWTDFDEIFSKFVYSLGWLLLDKKKFKYATPSGGCPHRLDFDNNKANIISFHILTFIYFSGFFISLNLIMCSFLYTRSLLLVFELSCVGGRFVASWTTWFSLQSSYDYIWSSLQSSYDYIVFFTHQLRQHGFLYRPVTTIWFSLQTSYDYMVFYAD